MDANNGERRFARETREKTRKGDGLLIHACANLVVKVRWDLARLLSAYGTGSLRRAAALSLLRANVCLPNQGRDRYAVRLNWYAVCLDRYAVTG